ncbi:hypothetical protein GCM10009125_11050 [Castellaniella daejeonensis]|uniref:DUF1010 domain-containing protein n=1 Tax=Castellaniella daejeonensis TaxID=659013 RepID=A0ABN0TK96_9BURK
MRLGFGRHRTVPIAPSLHLAACMRLGFGRHRTVPIAPSLHLAACMRLGFGRHRTVRRGLSCVLPHPRISSRPMMTNSMQAKISFRRASGSA